MSKENIINSLPSEIIYRWVNKKYGELITVTSQATGQTKTLYVCRECFDIRPCYHSDFGNAINNKRKNIKHVQ